MMAQRCYMPSVFIDINFELPKGFPLSYGSFAYGKFGIGCWQYRYEASNATFIYDGEMEWINTFHFRSDSKLTNPYAFRYYLHPGIVAKAFMVPTPLDESPDAIISAVTCNLLTGKGLPFKIPY